MSNFSERLEKELSFGVLNQMAEIAALQHVILNSWV